MSAKKNLLAGKLSAVAFVLLLLLITGTQTFAQEQQNTQANADLTQMSLEELMNVEVESSASLTKTTRRLTPAAVTTITQEEIWNSGARSIDELLDIYVPNFQWIRHPWEYNHLGARGIISDRDHKYLLLVNGKVMNEHSHFGALSERDLPTLRDIHHIDVIRGPGSALYGPGAIAMVISIVTENAMNFQGSETTGRLGAIEEFYSGEYKLSQKFDDKSGIYLYTGATKYVGADSGDAPFIWGRQYTGYGWSQDHEAGDAFSMDTDADNRAFRDQPKWKLFSQYTKGNFDIWGRYTRGGGYYGPSIFHTMWDANPDGWSTGYQQATIYASNKHELSETLGIEYAASYDMFDFERLTDSESTQDAHREDEYYGRLIAKWNPNDSHSVAFGGEISHEEFGFESPGDPAGESATSGTLVQTDPNLPFYNPTGELPRWSTNLYSMLGEHQWTINDHWTTFLGGRLDWHTLTPMMFSPRFVLAYSPNEKDTIKGSFSRSVRAPDAIEMKKNWDQNGDKTEPEKINVWELRYERQQSKKLWLAGSLFYQDQDVVGAASGVAEVGNLRTWGFEIEATYKGERTRITFSHSMTKLYDFSDTGASEFPPTTSDRGYGHDLANWSNHSTKLVGQYRLTDQFYIDGSLRIYWGFPGQRDYAQWVKDTRWSSWQQWCYDETHEETFGRTAFLNLGLQLKPSKDLTIRVDGYNLLGIFDPDLNKRFLAFDNLSPADGRSSAPALGVSLKYKF